MIDAGLTYLHVNDYTEKGEGGLNQKKESIKTLLVLVGQPLLFYPRALRLKNHEHFTQHSCRP